MTNKPDPVSSRTEVRSELDAEPRLSWLLRRKVTVPDRMAGFMDRAKLVERAMPTRNRLTVLMAPGGFGKTTLLAECCRRLSERGIVTAWISLDPSDDADVLDSYIAFAFRYAGLRIAGVSEGDGASENRAELVARALESSGEPFVLALDDLHQLNDPGSVALLDFLLKRGPPNLHLAAACRRLPAGLDIGSPVLDCQALVLGSDELRFSKSEINEFFGLRLTRRELASLAEESAGWPMALRIRRNSAGAAPGAGPARSIVENWVESRLWEGMDANDRELVLDAGLFEWIDGELLAEVLGARDAMRRLECMDSLAGLLNPVRNAGRDSWRLHPLLREHCARQRLRHARERYADLHHRIAVALAHRGETLPALRHAAESGDAELAGQILENAGAVRLWIRDGLAAFQAAVSLIDETVLASSPRLRLARCLSLLFSNRLAEARQAYRSMPKSGPGQASGGDGPDAPLFVDDRIVQGLLAFYGGESIGSERARALMADFRTIAASATNDPLIRGYAEHGLCLAHNALAEFDAAEDRAERALASLGGSAYVRMLVGFQIGQVAMAKGQVELARNTYANAMRAAKARFLDDAASIAIADVLLRELDLERHRHPPDPQPPAVPSALTRNGTPFLAYAAASGTAVGRALCSGDGSAMAVLQRMLDFVHGAGLPALVRYLSAMRVSLLASEGLTAEAERCWREAGLPEDTTVCLDRKAQTWREMEALSCARLRLFTAQERFDEARTFADALRASAAEGGLRRTLMRALVISVVLEDRAGDAARQRRHLEEFLTLFAETDYAWSAVCERCVCLPAVERFLKDAGDSPLREPAEALLAAMRSADADPALELSEREREILSRLDGKSDKVIAAELDLTASGVRYHLRKLFARLGATSRGEAVRRARELDLLSGDG